MSDGKTTPQKESKGPRWFTDPFSKLNDVLDARPIVPLIDKLSKLFIVVVAAMWLFDYSFVRPDRERDEKTRQAWQSIYQSAGKGGDGRRYEALVWLKGLSGKNLWGIDLQNASLADRDFCSWSLANVNLSGAVLWKADLSEAVLTRANLTGTNLWDAKLTSANLAEANLSGAILLGTRLEGVNLTNAVLSGARLEDADLTNADLSGADLTSATDLTAAQVLQATWLPGAWPRLSKELNAVLGANQENFEHYDRGGKTYVRWRNGARIIQPQTVVEAAGEKERK